MRFAATTVGHEKRHDLPGLLPKKGHLFQAHLGAIQANVPAGIVEPGDMPAPVPLLVQALREIRRVLKPGGLAYISEPVFAGEFNEILRLFHDEEQVRAAAFAAIQRAVDAGLLALREEAFFEIPVTYPDFETFEERVIHVTHTRHSLDEALYLAVRQRFMAGMTDAGATFSKPMRVDLLRRPGDFPA